MSLILSGTDGLSDVDGSAATPAIRGTDANTGIFFPAADTIAFTEGGVESMRIDSAGDVGIGTTNPVAKLHVVGGETRGVGTGFFYSGYRADGTTRQFYLGGSDTEFYINVDQAVPMLFTTSATERMRITSAGNVGIGTSSPAFASGTGLEVQRTGDATVRVERTDATNSAAEFVAGSGLVKIGATSGSPFAFITDNTERMRITAAGDVGIGMNSPQRKLVVHTGAIDNGIQITNDTSGSTAGSGFELIHYPGGEAYLINRRNSVMAFFTNNTERMRITSGGELRVGTTTNIISQERASIDAGASAGYGAVISTSTTGGYAALVCRNNDGNATNTQIFFVHGASTFVGSISTTSSTTAYNTSSDYRLKENIAPMTGALNVVQQLKPVTYNWKVNGSAGQGFIAHELAEVVPDCVTGEKDAVDANGNIKPQGIDTSFLVATLTAAIQEQQALIENLTTRLNALEGN